MASSKCILSCINGIWGIYAQVEPPNRLPIIYTWIGVDRTTEDISRKQMRFESSHNGNAVLLLSTPLDVNNTYELRETFGEGSDLPPPRRISRTTELIRTFEINL
jgi:hypothetical protein